MADKPKIVGNVKSVPRKEPPEPSKPVHTVKVNGRKIEFHGKGWGAFPKK